MFGSGLARRPDLNGLAKVLGTVHVMRLAFDNCNAERPRLMEHWPGQTKEA
jgi:hypothetical protein